MRTVRRLGGAGLLLSLLLPWVMFSVNACGLHQSFSGINLIVGGQHLRQQASQLLGGRVPPSMLNAITWITIALVLVAVGGIAGLAGSGAALPIAGIGVAVFIYLVSRAQNALAATAGVVTVTYRAGFYVALVSAAALVAAYARAPLPASERPRSAWSEAAAAKDTAPEVDPAGADFCADCGGRLAGRGRFCPHCGGRVARRATSAR